MKKFTLYVLVLLNIYSCGKLEESSLISKVDNETKYRILKSEQHFSATDSLWKKDSTERIYDSEGRLISVNHNSFYIYDTKGKIAYVRRVYTRPKTITKVYNEQYVYDKDDNLIAIVSDRNSARDTLQTYRYDSNNNLIFKGNGYRKTEYIYANNRLIEKYDFENDEVSRMTKYLYGSDGNKTIEDWTFSGNRMRTYFKYYPDGKLLSERDSSYSKTTNPNEYVEFKSEYSYLKNDSIRRINHLGRILGENDFKLRGYEIFEYNIK